MSERTAIIIGAGPAGLTAAYELLERSDVKPVVFEASEEIGGLARTVCHNGNRMDIGGHRFFSKSDRVMDWWVKMLPLQAATNGAPSDLQITYQRKSRPITLPSGGADPEAVDQVMLVRERVSRILFRRRFFPYPISLGLETMKNLGPVEIARIGLSYVHGRLRPRRPERSLEDFFVNRFGDRLYRTFFKDYTEKVWGVPCERIPADWGAQRVKGLSVARALLHALRQRIAPDASIRQKEAETSLIEQFLYPKLGPGQMWERVAGLVRDRGGELHLRRQAVKIRTAGDRVTAVEFRDPATGAIEVREGDYFFSTMPIQELVAGLDADVPEPIRRIAEGLVYRDFITVGLLLKRLRIQGHARPGQPAGLVPDNWIYVQEPDVRLGRLQIFNNWSPALVQDPDTIWLGLEYFCDQGDELWEKSDPEFVRFAIDELAKIGVIDPSDVLDSTIIRVPKTYPAYFGSYDRFAELRSYLDRFENLFLVGRNGMHRYNNQDHSMLTAMTAVDNIIAGVTSKENLWAVNTEQDYHEEK
jgi:protoporphyrinogen oxidase